MPIIEGFDELAAVPEEQIADKISRRVISGKLGMLVYIGEMKAARTWPLTSIRILSGT